MKMSKERIENLLANLDYNGKISLKEMWKNCNSSRLLNPFN